MHWRMTKSFFVSFFGCCVTVGGLAQTLQGQENPALESPSPVIVGETPATDSIPPTIAHPPSSTLPSPVLPPPAASNNKPRPSLGIVAEERADKKGLTVISVSTDSPAGNAGVRVGDVLTALNGRQTNSIEDVKDALAPLQAGDTTTIEVTRVGTIYELLSAPINFLEIVMGYVGAAATKALFIGVVILATSALFVDLTIQSPLAMLAFLVLTGLSFSLFGFIIGIWAGHFEQ